jgi:hypothetical protein
MVRRTGHAVRAQCGNAAQRLVVPGPTARRFSTTLGSDGPPRSCHWRRPPPASTSSARRAMPAMVLCYPLFFSPVLNIKHSHSTDLLLKLTQCQIAAYKAKRGGVFNKRTCAHLSGTAGAVLSVRLSKSGRLKGDRATCSVYLVNSCSSVQFRMRTGAINFYKNSERTLTENPVRRAVQGKKDALPVWA